MENIRSSNNRSSQKKWNFSKFIPILAGALLFANPDWAIAQNTSNQHRTQTEVSTSTILDRLNQKIWVSLPDEYNSKVLDFVLNDTIMRTRSATAYTEEFIINEMKEDRWINKQNQLLFIRSTIYEWISKNNLYDRLDDEDESRWNEYEKALKLINNSYEKYKTWFKTYMETKSAEYDKQSAETINSSLNNLVRFYNRYKKDPNSIKAEEVSRRKEDWKRVIKRCKELWIDYKSKLSPDMLKFYGVE